MGTIFDQTLNKMDFRDRRPFYLEFDKKVVPIGWFPLFLRTLHSTAYVGDQL